MRLILLSLFFRNSLKKKEVGKTSKKKEILNQKALIYEEIIQKALKINAVCIGSIKEQVSNDLIKITVSFFKKNE